MAKTPSQLLQDIRSDNLFVRCYAAGSPNATPEVLMIAIKDKDRDVRWHAARHLNTTPEILKIALKDEDEYVRRAAAQNRSATFEILFQLASEGGAGSGLARKRINSDPVMALQYAAYKAAKNKNPAKSSPAGSRP